MIRSRSNDSPQPAHIVDHRPPRAPFHPHDDRSQIESLAAERRRLVFKLLKEARKNHAEVTRRLFALLIANCILLTSLTLIPAILRAGSGVPSLSQPLILGEALAALLLLVSMILAVVGAVLGSPAGTASSITGETLPRQKVLEMAQADLNRLRQVETQASRFLRGSALFLLLALLPYLFVLVVLLVD